MFDLMIATACALQFSIKTIICVCVIEHQSGISIYKTHSIRLQLARSYRVLAFGGTYVDGAF